MGWRDELTEMVEIEVMRRAIDPVDDDIPDPGIDFNACVDALVKKALRRVRPLSPSQRNTYFLNKARSSHEWCRTTDSPTYLTRRIEQWLERLERRPS